MVNSLSNESPRIEGSCKGVPASCVSFRKTLSGREKSSSEAQALLALGNHEYDEFGYRQASIINGNPYTRQGATVETQVFSPGISTVRVVLLGPETPALSPAGAHRAG